MSLTVWSFALLHGFFVLIVAGLTHSKTAVAFAAIVAAVAGLLVGDPVYIALDLLCVAVATYYCWTDLAKRHQRTPQEIAAAQEKIRLEQRKAEEAAAKRKKTTTDFLQGALMLGAAVFVLYSKFWQPTVAQKNTANATIQQQQQQQQQQPTANSPGHHRPPNLPRVRHPEQHQANQPAHHRPIDPDVLQVLADVQLNKL